MARQIKSNEIFEDDLFKNIRESAERTIESIERINEEFKNTGKALKESIGGAKFDSTKSINEFIKATNQANKLKMDSLKIDKALIDARKQKAMAENAESKTAQQDIKTKREQIRLENDLARETERAAKAAEKAAKAAKDESSAYKKLEKNTRELKNESKELAAQMLKLELSGKKNTKEFRELASKYRDVSRAAIDGDKALKKIDGTVGDNFRNVGNYNGAIGKLRSGLGELGLAFGIGSIVSNAGQKIVEFDQKIADLVSITGASGKDLDFFKQQSIELGKGVQGGAASVIEAYKLIGSAKPELLANAASLDAVTQSAITLSQASGMTLPEAATALTDAMNQFGAPAEQAGKFIDALANGALAGSAEIPQVTEALLKFGAIAKTSNVQLDESVGLIEALAERGLKGAEAGTALRNVMLKLSAPDALPKEARDMMQKLGIDMEAMADPSKTFSERLEVMKPLLSDNAAMVKVFGSENVVAATNLISSTDRINDLTAAMNTQGTATDQANTRNQTLSFALNQLKESWNALFLELMSGQGTTKILVDGLVFVAENLGTILKWVAKIAAYWLIYNAAIKTANAANFVMNGGLKSLGASMLNVFKSQKKVADGATVMGDNIGKAGKTMNAIPWIAIIGAVIELAVAFYDVASGAKAAREASAAAEKTLADAHEKASTRSGERQSNLQKELAELQRLKNESKDQAKAEREFLIEKEKLLSKTKTAIDNDIKAVRTRKNEYLDQKKIIESALGSSVNKQISATTMAGEKLEETFKKMGISTDELKNWAGSFETNLVNAELIKLQGRIDATSERITIYKDELEQTDETLKDATSELTINSNAHEDNRGKIDAKIPSMKKLNIEMDKYNEYLTKQTDLLNKLALIEKQRESEAAQTEIDLQLSSDVQNALETGDVDTEKVENLIEKKFKIERDAIELKTQFEREQLEQTYQLESSLAEQRVRENYEKLIAQENLTSEEKKTINDQYQLQLAELENDQLQRAADLELELRLLKEATTDDLIALEIEKNQQINDVNDKLIEAQITHYDRITKESTKLVDNEKINAERRIEYFKIVTDYFLKRSNERIAQIDKEINKANEQFDTLKQLAVNGNINAKESLAEQQRLINEANLKKEKEQKRQQRLQLLNTAFSTYNQKVANGSKNPLAETIRDIGLLRAFIETIPAFESGIEDTGTNGRGVDGRGGFHAILHPNERVVPKSLNEKIGDLSNEQLARLAVDYHNGNMVGNIDNVGSAMDVAILVNKIDQLNETIKNKPETNIELGEIMHGSIEIVKTITKGNTKTFNRYKIKP